MARQYTQMWNGKSTNFINKMKRLQANATATKHILRAYKAEEATMDIIKICKEIGPLDYSRSSSQYYTRKVSIQIPP